MKNKSPDVPPLLESQMGFKESAFEGMNILVPLVAAFHYTNTQHKAHKITELRQKQAHTHSHAISKRGR